MEFPVTFESEALEKLKKIYDRKAVGSQFWRVGVKGGGCSGLEYALYLDTQMRENDLVLEVQEMKFVCDQVSATFLAGTVVLVNKNLLGPGFEFDNPNAQRSCGCGTSFTPKSD